MIIFVVLLLWEINTKVGVSLQTVVGLLKIFFFLSLISQLDSARKWLAGPSVYWENVPFADLFLYASPLEASYFGSGLSPWITTKPDRFQTHSWHYVTASLLLLWRSTASNSQETKKPQGRVFFQCLSFFFGGSLRQGGLTSPVCYGCDQLSLTLHVSSCLFFPEKVLSTLGLKWFFCILPNLPVVIQCFKIERPLVQNTWNTHTIDSKKIFFVDFIYLWKLTLANSCQTMLGSFMQTMRWLWNLSQS